MAAHVSILFADWLIDFPNKEIIWTNQFEHLGKYEVILLVKLTTERNYLSIQN